VFITTPPPFRELAKQTWPELDFLYLEDMTGETTADIP
jgi:hypothetical protein